MAKKQITRRELDAWLDPAAEDAERFDALVAEKIKTADALGLSLEIRDPADWKKPDATPHGERPTTFLNQFRFDVDSILTLDRKDEARLARAVEFARARLERARQRYSISAEDLDEGLAHPDLGWSREAADEVVRTSRLPKDVSRRWAELHGLRTELVERNLYLVLINVERYVQTGASRVDLIQEGCISLFRAVDGFDWRRGLLFRTYAVHWLNQAFRNHLYNFGHTVRVPIYLQKVMKRVQEARIELGDPKASAREIADVGELDEHLVSTAVRASRANFSLDAELGSAGGNRLGDFIEDSHRFEDEVAEIDRISLEHDLATALKDLKDRERYVLRMRFGLGVDREYTLAEVAHALDISVERVRQIQMSALRKLGAPAMRRQFEAYLN
jgi:RNA polymerase sigma factor (sigma-70 family)